MKDREDPRTENAYAGLNEERSPRLVRRLVSPKNGPCSDSIVKGSGSDDTSQRDDSINTMSSRYKKTEDLLESLHRRLSEQAVSVPHESELSVRDRALSGARTRKVGRRQYAVPERAGRTVTKRKREASPNVTGMISKMEELVSLSESLGIDMTKVVKKVASAKAALGRSQPDNAKRFAGSADRVARDVISRRLPSLVLETNSSLRQLESVCGTTKALRQLMGQAKNSLKTGEHDEAMRLLSDARRGIHKAEREALLGIIAEAKGKFITAKKSGINFDAAVSLLNKSRDTFRKGGFAQAVEYARESRRVVEVSLESHREAKYPLLECIKSIKLAEALGAEVGELNEMLSQAKQLFKQNELEPCADLSRRLLELAKKTAYGKAAESYGLAEKALALAKKTVAEVPESEEELVKSREMLEKKIDELVKDALRHDSHAIKKKLQEIVPEYTPQENESVL